MDALVGGWSINRSSYPPQTSFIQQCIGRVAFLSSRLEYSYSHMSF